MNFPRAEFSRGKILRRGVVRGGGNLPVGSFPKTLCLTFSYALTKSFRKHERAFNVFLTLVTMTNISSS